LPGESPDEAVYMGHLSSSVAGIVGKRWKKDERVPVNDMTISLMRTGNSLSARKR